MGNLISSMAHANASSQWPPHYDEFNKHWCLAFQKAMIDILQKSSEDDPNTVITCHDTRLSQQDPNFDYSQFCCAGAACQICLDLTTEFFPAKKLNPGSFSNEKDPASKEIHFTWKALLECAESGTCQACSILVEGIREVAGSTGELDPLDVFCLELRNGYTVRIVQERSKTEDVNLCVEFYSHAGESD